MSDGLAFIRGLGDQATLGLTRYPAAALMVGMDRLRGGVSGKKLSYRQALAEIREQERTDAAEHGGARLAGQVGGGLVNAVMTGGAGTVGTIGRTAAQGAVQGFTQNEGMEGAVQDTLTGGAVGGVLGGAGAAVNKGLSALRGLAGKMPEVQQAHLARVSANYDSSAARVLQSPEALALRASSRRPMTDDQVINSLAKGGRAKLARDNPVRQAAQQASGSRLAFEDAVRKIEAGTFRATEYAMLPAARDTFRSGMNTLRGTLGNAGDVAGGAVIGGAVGAMMGQDPLTSAMAGAAPGLWAARGRFGDAATRLGMGAAIALRPRPGVLNTAETLARGANQVATPVMVSQREVQGAMQGSPAQQPIILENWQWDDEGTPAAPARAASQPMVLDNWVWED